MLAIFFSFIILTYSCGKDNLFTNINTGDSKQKAADKINNGNYDEAIVLLLPYTHNNSGDYLARSMLANAYMLKAGINIINIFIAIGNNINKSKNNLYTVLNSFPTGNPSNIAYLNIALQNLALIPSDVLTPDQQLQSAIAHAALGLFTISMDLVDPSTGIISATQVASISITDADTIYNSFSTVQSLLLALGEIAEAGSGTGIILDLINQITSTAGGSNYQRLAIYLAANA